MEIMGASESTRYGKDVSPGSLARYREREISNCEARLARGDSQALAS